MTKETDSDVAASKAPTRAGSSRRFLDGWKQFEKAMDYGAYAYALDRIQALEKRLLQSESATATDVPIEVVQAQDDRFNSGAQLRQPHSSFKSHNKRRNPMTPAQPRKSSLMALVYLSWGVLFNSASALGADRADDPQTQARALLDRPNVHLTLGNGDQGRRRERLEDPQSQARQLLGGHTVATRSETALASSHSSCRASCTYPDAQESARRLLTGQSSGPHLDKQGPAKSSLSRAKAH